VPFLLLLRGSTIFEVAEHWAYAVALAQVVASCCSTSSQDVLSYEQNFVCPVIAIRITLSALFMVHAAELMLLMPCCTAVSFLL